MLISRQDHRKVDNANCNEKEEENTHACSCSEEGRQNGIGRVDNELSTDNNGRSDTPEGICQQKNYKENQVVITMSVIVTRGITVEPDKDREIEEEVERTCEIIDTSHQFLSCSTDGRRH